MNSSRKNSIRIHIEIREDCTERRLRMPNWIEGTLKLRGKPENIIKFVETGINKYRFDFDKAESILLPHDFTRIDKSPYGIEVDINDTAYIEGSYRAFVEPCSFYMDDEEQVVVIPFRQAWGLKSSDYVDISQKYDIDVRVYGVECGMEFCQELEVIKGEITKQAEYHYNDWAWECPFPNMGG